MNIDKEILAKLELIEDLRDTFYNRIDDNMEWQVAGIKEVFERSIQQVLSNSWIQDIREDGRKEG